MTHNIANEIRLIFIVEAVTSRCKNQGIDAFVKHYFDQFAKTKLGRHEKVVDVINVDVAIH